MKVADIRLEADAKYIDLPLERDDGSVIRLRNLLRLDDTARKSAQVLIKALNDTGPEDVDDFDQIARQESTLRDLYLLVADDRDRMDAELSGWDLPMKLYVLEKYTETTQPGEAQSSAD